MITEVKNSDGALDPGRHLPEAAQVGGVAAAMPGGALPAESVAVEAPLAEKAQPALADLLTTETPSNYFGVFHMLVAFIGMTASTVLVLFVNSNLAFPLCLFIYVAMTAYEVSHKIYSPVSFSLIAFYLILYGLFLTDNPYLGYFGLASFAWLALLSVVLFAIGKPLTTFYTDKHGSVFFHRLISGIWLAAFVLSFAAGVLLMPEIWYLVVPFAICFCTCAFVIYLNFFDTTLVTRREREFVKGVYSFKQIDYPSKEYEEYLDFYSGILVDEVYGKEQYQSEESALELREAIRHFDGATSARKVIFGAYRDGALIGTIGIGLDAPGMPFPIEEVMDCSFDPLRGLGRIVDIGRFCIAKKYRESPEVIEGLFKGVLEYALVNDASFLIAEVLASSGVTYARLGFNPLMPRSDPRAKNLSTPSMGAFQVLFNNLAHAVFFKRKESVNESLGFFGNANDLLAERWVKRMVVSHVLASKVQRPWMHTISSVRQMLGLSLGRR